MARIIKGGMVNSTRQSENEEVHPQQQPTSNNAETWGEYGLRNIAKAPGIWYQLGRSGLGVGGALSKLIREAPALGYDLGYTDEPERLLDKPFNALLRGALPSWEEAGEETAAVLPKYFTESRPGDWLPEFITSEIPFWLAGGGLKSLPAFGKAALQSAGMGAGIVGGSKVGGAIGEQLGSRQAGELLGGLGGGLLGGHVASKGTNLLPSKTIPAKILEKEKNLFHEGQQSQLKNLEHEHAPRIKELETQHKKSISALPKRKELFEAEKKQSLNKIKHEVDTYSNKIKELDTERTHAYTEAKKLDKGIKGNASSLNDGIKEAGQNIQHGVPASDTKLINHNLKAVESAIKNNELSLESAKRLQKNFNDQIYNRDSSNSFKNIMRPIVNDLNEFIERTGTPEHTQYWKQAETQTRELKQLQKGRKDFIKSTEQAKRDILREKFSPVEESNLKLEQKELAGMHKAAQSDYEKLSKDIGAKKFGELEKNLNPSSIDKIVNFVESNFTKGNIGAFGLSAAFHLLLGIPKRYASVLGGGIVKGIERIANEYNIFQSALKHPEIHAEYTKLWKDWNGKPSATFIKHLNSFDEKVEKVVKEPNKEESTPKTSRIIRGGMINY